MYKTQSFKKKMLVTAVASAAMAGFTAPTFAQDEAVEEVVVTGIRASLERSVDIKRNSQGVVDAISAEDIGKFPDTNLAESMQRISGVSIDRNNGEGSRITVRGFGADRNLITLNGRQLPTTTGDRSFEFGNVASEAVSAVEVYKTSDATVTSGGMGATVNLVTHKPLKAPGLKATIGAKLANDTSATRGSDDITPEVSGLISNTFMDDTFGVSLSASYQERDSGLTEFLQDQGYRAHVAADTGWGAAPAAPAGGENRPSEGILSLPQQPRYIFEDRQRERLNGQLVLQWQPIDTLTLTTDYTYINNTVETQHTDVSAWFGYAGDRSGSVWGGNEATDIYYPVIYSEIYASNQDTSLTVGAYGQEEEIDSFGFNAKWEASDSLTLELDVHTSEGNLKATDPNHGTRNNMQLPSYTRSRTALDLGGSLPGIQIGANDLALFNPDTLQLSGSWFQNNRYTSSVDEVQVQGNFIFNENSNIDFGVALNKVDNQFRFVAVERTDWGGIGAPGDFAGFEWDEDTVVDKFQDAPRGNLPGYTLLDRVWFADFDTVVAAADASDNVWLTTGGIEGDCAPNPGGQAGPNGGGQFCASTDFDRGTHRYTEEETTAIYAQWNSQGEITGKTYDLHLGLRYETTDVYSYSYTVKYSGLEWVEATQAALTGAAEPAEESKSADYSTVLPSINFNVDLAEDVKLRTAIGKTIARAPYNLLQGGTSVNGAGNLGGFSGTSGNPGLKPLESFNLDFALEWYYDDASYASIGAFRKEVKNFDSVTRIQSDAGMSIGNIFDGERFNAAVTALGSGASNDQIREWIFDNYLGDPDVQPNLGTVDPDDGRIVSNDTDNDIVFNITVPTNSSEKRTVSGLELTIQHMFGESGFGTMANYTIVDSDLAYDNLRIATTPAITGLSDTANLVLFYDNNGLQARVAYNWRDEFLSERRVVGDADLTAGIYTERYSQIDLSVSYDLPMVEGLTVFLEGINVTDEYVKTHGRLDQLVYRVSETGPRYNLGVRYTF